MMQSLRIVVYSTTGPIVNLPFPESTQTFIVTGRYQHAESGDLRTGKTLFGGSFGYLDIPPGGHVEIEHQWVQPDANQ